MTEQLQLLTVPTETVFRATNGQLLAEVWRLLCGLRPKLDPLDSTGVVVDTTYGTGQFWTHVRPAGLIAHDLDPRKGDGVDCQLLPEEDGSIEFVVVDLPYVVVGGRKTTTIPDMHDRYGMTVAARSERELVELHTAAMTEARRVLRPGGWLLLKYADGVSSGHVVWLSDHVARIAAALCMEKFAEIVHHTGPGPQPDHGVQVHPRRAHSFLGVFRTPGRLREATDERRQP